MSAVLRAVVLGYRAILSNRPDRAVHVKDARDITHRVMHHTECDVNKEAVLW